MAGLEARLRQRRLEQLDRVTGGVAELATLGAKGPRSSDPDRKTKEVSPVVTQ
jgi:hypothetical protein